MKTTLLLSAPFILLFLSAPGLATETGSPVVQNEYAKQQAQLEAQLHKAKHTLKELEAQREKASNESKALGQSELQGVRTLKRFDTLMTSRYATEQGEFQNWRPMAQADVDNLNKLLDTFLHLHPLSGRVSAGQAHRWLDWAMSRLEQLAKQHNAPSSENNSDLEIIAHQTKEAETTVKAVLASADRLGIKLDVTSPSDADAGRAPASEPEAPRASND